MILIIVIIAYSLVALLAARMLAGHFAWDWALRDARGQKRTLPYRYEHFDPETVTPNPGWWGYERRDRSCEEPRSNTWTSRS